MLLYDIPAAIRDTLEQAVDPDTGEIDETLDAHLDALQEEFERKAEYIALLSREAKAEAAAVKEEEDRLRARRVAAENRERRLKDYLHASLNAAGVERIEGDKIKIRVQQNSRPSIRWTRSEDEIPEPYRRVTVSVDGHLAYDEWKAGHKLPDGFEVETGSHCRVW